VRRFVLRRLAHGAAVIFIAASLSFLLIHLAPGDPLAGTLDSPLLDPAAKDAVRKAYGLDGTIAEQYVRFLQQLARGNLGPSLLQSRPAAEALAEALPPTLLLMGTSLVFSFAIGVLLGAWQAARAGTHADRVTGFMSLVVASLPEFWLGLVLLLLLAYRFPLFPASGMVDFVTHRGLVRHLVLPALTLTLLGSASIARYQRSAVLDVLPQDFVRTARAKGVNERRVLWRHALRNALLPTIVLAGLSLPTLLGGAVFVERIYSWPGLGGLAADAFQARDYQVVIGATIIGAVLVVVGGILTDVLHAAVDPRVRAR
jgi:peptide/nickel transport system permease protein